LEGLESFLVFTVRWLKLILETAGAIVVGAGVVAALLAIVRGLRAAGSFRFTAVRLQFAKYLSLALELQLAADILGTTIAPSWAQIGKLGAIAVIRTALNYFLGLEMREERETLAGETAVSREAAGKDRAAREAAAVP
jgi:uncharacterized membrane protein